MSTTERGQVLPLVALVVVLGGVCTVLLGRIGAAAVDRARARTAADAAALAGAAEGVGAARSIAAANGGEVVSYATAGADVVVRVRVGDATAPARARREGGASWRELGIHAGSPVPGQGMGGADSQLRRAPP